MDFSDASFEADFRIFEFFQSLNFSDEIQFELRTDPRAKFNGNIYLSISATIASSCCKYAFAIDFLSSL